ncbi:hypothetical protein Tco_0184570 [Tanacetum coccineum]
MSRDMITVGSTMRIPLLYRGEYSQWHERFMNYLEEQTDGEAMIKFYQNGDHHLPVYCSSVLDGTAPNDLPTLKDPNFGMSDSLALVLLLEKKTKVNKRKEKVAVQSESEGSDDEDISDLKKITALLAKAFNERIILLSLKQNNNLRNFFSFFFSKHRNQKESSHMQKGTIAEIHDQSEVDHNDSEDKDHLVDKLIKKFNQKILRKRINKAKI